MILPSPGVHMSHHVWPGSDADRVRTLPSPRVTCIAWWLVEARAPSHLLLAPVHGVGWTWNFDAGPAPVFHHVCQANRGKYTNPSCHHAHSEPRSVPGPLIGGW